LGQAAPAMQCTGLNNGQAAEVLDGSLCQNLGCRLAIPGCLTAPGGFGGHCVGRVVALGPLVRSHPEGVKFLGYPCIDAGPSSSTLNLFGELTDKGYYVAQQWTACNCNSGNLDGSTGFAPGSSSSSGVGLPAASDQQEQQQQDGAAAAMPSGLQQYLQLLSSYASGLNASSNPAAAAAGGEVSPTGLAAARGQLSGMQGQVLPPNIAALAGLQGSPQELLKLQGMGGLGNPQPGNGATAAAGSSGSDGGSSGGLNWGDLLKEASVRAVAAAAKGVEGTPANGTANVLGGWMSALLSAAGAGQQQQQQQQSPALQPAGQQQQGGGQNQNPGAAFVGLLSKVLSAAKGQQGKQGRRGQGASFVGCWGLMVHVRPRAT
jgi:hypothetical protein